MGKHSIRRAGPEDAELLAELGARTFRDTFASANRPEDIETYIAEAFAVDSIGEALVDSHCHFWIAYESSGRAVGYEKLREGSSPACVRGVAPVEIQRIYVSEAAIGTGLGAALMRTALAWAERGEFDSVWLGVWEQNVRAVEFYERWGFTTVGDHIFTLGKDRQTDLIMERSL